MMKKPYTLNDNLAYTDISSHLFDNYNKGNSDGNNLIHLYTRQNSATNPARLVFGYGAALGAMAATLAIAITPVLAIQEPSNLVKYVSYSLGGVSALLQGRRTKLENKGTTSILLFEKEGVSQMDCQFGVWAARRAHTKPLFPVIKAFGGGVWHGVRNNMMTSSLDGLLYMGKTSCEYLAQIKPVAKVLDLFRVMGRDLMFRTKFGQPIKNDKQVRFIPGTKMPSGIHDFSVLRKKPIVSVEHGEELVRQSLKVASRNYRKRVVDPAYAA